MRKLSIALVGGLLALGIGAASASAHPSVYTCRPYHMGLFNFRNNQEWVWNLSVRNMSCVSAKVAMFDGPLLSNWRFRTAGYRCYDVARDPHGLGAIVRCVRGSTAFRFTTMT
jgi:hypothetical protein